MNEELQKQIEILQQQVILLRCILQSVCPTNNKYINECLKQLRDLNSQQESSSEYVNFIARIRRHMRDSGGSE